MSIAYLGIGANLGDARASVLAAIAGIAQMRLTKLIASSSLYGSAPVDSSGDDYVNAVVSISTGLSPQELLAEIQALELAHGRERPYRNAPRTLDLDILLYDELQIQQTDLEIPHPRMTERAFVLLPLLEIQADIHIPGKANAGSYLPGVANQVICKLAVA